MLVLILTKSPILTILKFNFNLNALEFLFLNRINLKNICFVFSILKNIKKKINKIQFSIVLWSFIIKQRNTRIHGSIHNLDIKNKHI
jgi:hypothetical protein